MSILTRDELIQHEQNIITYCEQQIKTRTLPSDRTDFEKRIAIACRYCEVVEDNDEEYDGCDEVYPGTCDCPSFGMCPICSEDEVPRTLSKVDVAIAELNALYIRQYSVDGDDAEGYRLFLDGVKVTHSLYSTLPLLELLQTLRSIHTCLNT